MNLQDMFGLCTSATQELINSAGKIASEKHNPTLKPLHLLKASLTQQFCITFFQALQVPLDELKERVDTELNKLPTVLGGALGVDSSLETFLAACKKWAEKCGDSYISLEHLLLEWTQTNTLPKEIHTFFNAHKVTVGSVQNYMKTVRGGKQADSKNAEENYQLLEKYCINVTQQAQDGKLDPVIGRHEEIRRVMQILSRRTKNNPVLIGEPGVGKTAIVEGIAQRIVAHDVPETLKNKILYSVDLGLLIAGAKYQGEFEERLKGLLKEIESHKDDIILFIDELHMLVGTGSTGGGMDASNLLKPALARGNLHCIGATTIAEYKKYIEKDAALERRFQQVLVPEPSIEDAISILRGLKERFELHHGIHIKDQALVDAVLLSVKNIPDRFLPDKAIDLVDEAAAMVKMSIDSQPEVIDKIERKIRQLEIEKVALTGEKNDPAAKIRLEQLEKELSEAKEQFNGLVAQWKSEKEPLEKINKIKEDIERAHYQFQQAERDGDFAKASEIKYGTLARLEKQLSVEYEKQKKASMHMLKQEVDETDIAKIVSRWTGIPAEKLQATESQKYILMADILKKRVAGQDEAITAVCNAIQLHKVGLTDPHKPIGSFLFLGPTGVGKTEVAKTLASFLFNDEKRLIRIDMSEYMEKHSVARLIGAPPGYVGYEEGGQLTEQVRRHPYSVILFDEIEKAHPEVFNIFLQILDEGHLTDSQGRTVSFKNCIIIMTSNIGSDIILENKEITESVKQQIQALLHKTFRPEFLNRIDDIIFFRTLSEKDIREIVSIQLHNLFERLKGQHITVSISDAAIAKIAELGYQKEFGARPLKRAIQTYIMVPLSQQLLHNNGIKHFTIDCVNDALKITNT